MDNIFKPSIFDALLLAADNEHRRPNGPTLNGRPIDFSKVPTPKENSEMSDYSKDMDRIQRIIDAGNEMVELLKALIDPSKPTMDLRIRAVMIISKIEGGLE